MPLPPDDELPPPYRFNAGRWVKGNNFLGRVALLRDIVQCLRNPEQFHCRRYVGRRRQGKTSFLHAVEFLARCMNKPEEATLPEVRGPVHEDHDLLQFASVYRREGWLTPHADQRHIRLIPAYVDLRVHRKEHEVIGRLAVAAQRVLDAGSLVADVRGSDSPTETFFETLATLNDEQPLCLIVLADEGRGLAPTEEELAAAPELAGDVLGVIRLLDRLMTQGELNVQLYMSSTRGLDLGAAGQLKRLLDSIPVFPLGNLEDKAVQVMMTRSGLGDDITSRLQERCGGNPFFLHVLGFAEQNEAARPEPQIEAGIENDLDHVTAEERAWLESLAVGGAGQVPGTIEMLERCGYVRQTGRAERPYALREPLLKDWLAGLNAPPSEPEPTPAPSPARSRRTRSASQIEMSLDRYPWPSRQRFGQLNVGPIGPINLGAQCYALLHLLCLTRRMPKRLLVHQDDSKFPLYLVLSVCGVDHGYLNPRGLLSGVRNSFRETAEAQGVPEATTERLQIWLPRGRGGYRLGDEVDVVLAGHPLGHLENLEIDLIAVYKNWYKQRRAFLRFLKDSAVNQTPGRSVRIELRRAHEDLFPRHDYVARILVLENTSDRPIIEMGPIPFTDNQAVAFRYWRRVHMDEGVVHLGELEREMRADGHPIARATDFCMPFELLALRGAPFSKGSKRWSSEWIPGPGTARDFPTAPRWLDLHLIEDTHALPYDAPDLRKDCRF
ncbi:MAG: hypothetical protein H6739_22540 [Alphaproteobacteria bacterium]|nr:hypothetical protein [Alphaproteobacteria bacterium]